MKLHTDDRAIAIAFVDYARLHQPENIRLEILARHLAEHLNINPNLPNTRLANRFATVLERN